MRPSKSPKELRQLKRQIVQYRRDIGNQLFKERGGYVMGGCLCGFRLLEESSWGQADLFTKLLGIYEQQNQPIFVESTKPILVDLGAADGYWGVGLVQAGHFERSLCFEQRRKARQIIRKTLHANGVRDRVEIAATATDTSIRELVSSRYQPQDLFFLIDIEGGEFELLTFEFLSEFKSSEFLIELHSSGVWLGNEKEERLIRDAQVLFDVELVDDTKRDLLQLRNELQMPDDLTWVLASEGRRYPMRWLHLKPKREPKNAALPKKRSEQKKDQKFGTLWMGGEPGKLERACLNSMKDFGYNPIVFSYEPIRNLPEGVEYFDAREIYEPGRVIRHVRHKSPAIHADIFRYHLISKTGMIWLDTDMYMVASAERLMASAESRAGFCVGCVFPDLPRHQTYHSLVNNAVFGLPAHSKSLALLGEVFEEDQLVSEAWKDSPALLGLNAAVEAQREKPFGRLRWGSTGPRALTTALNMSGERKYAHDSTAFYHISSREIPALFQAGTRLSDFVTPTTFGFHLWGRDFRSALSELDPNVQQCAARDILESAV